MSEHHSSPQSPIDRAIALAGSQSALARMLGVSQHAVWGWSRKGRLLPGEHVLKIEEQTGVSRHDLRPDLYPRTSADDSQPTRTNEVDA